MIITAIWLLLLARLAFSIARYFFGPRHALARNFASLIADATALCLFALSFPA